MFHIFCVDCQTIFACQINIQKILIIATATGTYADRKTATELWLSEFTHIYHRAKEQGYDITIANPQGGDVPVDPESLKPIVLDKVSEGYWNNAAFGELMHHAQSLNQVLGQQSGCVYLAGGHSSMYDFPDNTVLQTIITGHYEDHKLVAAVCHGASGLLNVKLSGRYLIKDKGLTRFSWLEESLAKHRKRISSLYLAGKSFYQFDTGYRYPYGKIVITPA